MDKPNKVNAKQQQIYNERARRLINQGVDPSKVDQIIAKEDYERMSPAQKISRLESMIVRTNRGIASDISTITENQRTLADFMDVNFAAFSKILESLGVSKEKQREIVEGVEAEFLAKRQAEEEEKAKALHESLEAQAKKHVEQTVDVPAPKDSPAETPEGATVFGG